MSLTSRHGNRRRRRLLVGLPAAAVTVAAVTTGTAAEAARDSNFAFTSQVSYSGTNPCTGKNVTVTGTERDLYHTSYDGSGGIHLETHYSSSDVRGTDDDGHAYRASYSFNDSENLHVGQQITQLDTTRFVGQGSAANFTTRTTFHTTVNADGTITSSRTYQVDPVCRH